MVKTSSAVRITGIFIYTDTYGHPYETNICITYIASGDTQYCPGNQIK
jgi:hypothetical protein